MTTSRGPGEGLPFHFQPAPPDPGGEESPAPVKETNKRARVLIVDDTAPILDMFREYFRSGPFDVVLAGEGAEAMRLVDEEPFNVVVTDLRMHPVSGIDVLRHVKMHRPEVEVIVLTGYASVESAIESIRFNVFDYVEKPVNLSRFSRVIQNAIEKNRLTTENQRLTALLGEQNRRLEERVREVTRELEELSVRDALTGLHNYRFFTNVLVAEISRALRYGRTLSLAMIDVDYFKQYNDTHGHQKGNEALLAIGRILKRQTRENDYAVRYGGEEFAVLLPETGAREAVSILERMKKSVQDLGLETECPEGVRQAVSFSAGLAMCPQHAKTDAALVEAADRALYRAKAEGRNRIVVAE